MNFRRESKSTSNYLIFPYTDDTVFAEVVNAEQNVIRDLEKKSKCKPILVFHDESNVINACDVISEMALNGKYLVWASYNRIIVFRYLSKPELYIILLFNRTVQMPTLRIY
jgi:hypothetical protein